MNWSPLFSLRKFSVTQTGRSNTSLLEKKLFKIDQHLETLPLLVMKESLGY